MTFSGDVDVLSTVTFYSFSNTFLAGGIEGSCIDKVDPHIQAVSDDRDRFFLGDTLDRNATKPYA